MRLISCIFYLIKFYYSLKPISKASGPLVVNSQADKIGSRSFGIAYLCLTGMGDSAEGRRLDGGSSSSRCFD